MPKLRSLFGVARRKAGQAGERFERATYFRSDSGVSVWVIPTNEELMIAQHTLALVRP
jgi:acetate kinase